mgnify:CR=1 FL=1
MPGPTTASAPHHALYQRHARIDAGRPNIDVRYKTVLIESPVVPSDPAETENAAP